MPQLSQAVPAAMSQVGWRHMRTRLKVLQMTELLVESNLKEPSWLQSIIAGSPMVAGIIPLPATAARSAACCCWTSLGRALLTST